MSRTIVGPFNRVEGDLEVALDIDDGRIRSAEVTTTLYRGYEQLLDGRVPLDALVIAPRVCGICSVSQSIAAAAALRELAGGEAADNGALATNIAHAAENVADHLTHFYLFFMPDFARAEYAGRRGFEATARRFKAVTGEAAREVLPARRRLLEIMGVLAGKWPHSLAFQPGGTTRAVGMGERVQLLSLVAEFQTFLESTLFGHKAGAFTGATRDQPGLFEEAEKGTIFLDEIGDTTPAMQLKLLRVLQEREIMRVGETRPRKVDVRVISATNHDLQKAVHDNSFREDLYYRLRVVEIEVPPLRCRKDDILPLARHFVKKCAAHLGLPALRLDATSLDRLLEYSWPGNVRELENAVEHAAVFCQDSVILPKHFPSRILGKCEPREDRKDVDLAKRSLADIEWDHIQRVLSAAAGNRAEAAKILGIGEATLYRRLREPQHEHTS